jgi:DNA-binding winged helix-turn-helix (wHTH) protein
MNYRIALLDETLQAHFRHVEIAVDTELATTVVHPEAWLNSLLGDAVTLLVINPADTSIRNTATLRCANRLIENGKKIAVLGLLEWNALTQVLEVTPEQKQNLNLQALDDFLLLPLEAIEVHLRFIRLANYAVARSEAMVKNFIYGPIQFELETFKTSVGGTPISLTRRESELLLFLCRKAQTVVSRQQIATDVWKIPRATASFDSVLNGHISRLRHKLGAVGFQHILQSIPKRGITINLTTSNC